MDLKEVIEEGRIEKSLSDVLNIPCLTPVDIEICNYVSHQLRDIDIANIYYGSKISFEELLYTSIKELSIFGDNKFNLLNLNNPNNVIRSDNVFGFGTCISYFDNSLYNGNVRYYCIPNELYQFSSAFLCHEHIHALKDVIYNEYYYNKILGETIPLFYELISFDDNINLRSQMLKLRMNFILDNRIEYNLLTGWIDNSRGEYCKTRNKDFLDNMRIFEFMRSKVGCYLNSYYYAIRLYELYKNNSKMVLDLVSMVLTGNITTFDLLYNLGIYGDISGYIFEKEIKDIKKLIK